MICFSEQRWSGCLFSFKESDFAMSLTNSQLKILGLLKHAVRSANAERFLTDFGGLHAIVRAPMAFMALPILMVTTSWSDCSGFTCAKSPR